MSDTLKDALTDIQGVGDATADKILDVLDSHDTTEREEVAENVTLAWEYYDAGETSYAGKFLKRAYEAVE